MKLDLRLDIKTPKCPLCHKQMERELRLKRGIYVFACHTPGTCGIAIAVDDPFVGKWEAVLDKTTKGAGIPCPMAETKRACKGKMRYFATRTGYMKAVCPESKCGAKVANMVRDRAKDEVYTPEAPSVVQGGEAQLPKEGSA